MFRSHTCGELRLSDAGKSVTLAGWVQRARKMGGMTFVDLRDRYGITQVVFNEAVNAELCERANHLGREFVIQITGEVNERSNKNMNIPTGEIEIIVSVLNVLNSAVTPPFTIEDNSDGGDDIRMKFRYLDLRRNCVRKNLELRHKMTMEVRRYLDSKGFLEVETPMLVAVFEVWTMFFEALMMPCARLPGSLTTHWAEALPAKSRHRHTVIAILVFILIFFGFSGCTFLFFCRVLRFVACTHIVPVRREGQHVGSLVIGHVDAESRVHEQVAVLLLQEVGFRFQPAADAAPFEHRHLVGFALLVDEHVGLSLHACPVPAQLVAAVIRHVAGLQHHDCQSY